MQQWKLHKLYQMSKLQADFAYFSDIICSVMAKQRPGFVVPNDQLLIKRANEIPVPEITSSPSQQLIERMLTLAYGEQTDRKKPVLVGLAAPQVGISKRIILVDVGAVMDMEK